MKIRIAERITELMNASNLTQVELAKTLSIGQSTISEWISGKKMPGLTSLWLLADYFDTDIDYLIGRKDF